MSKVFSQYDYHKEGSPSAKQAEASDPSRSVWVAASAGTGKTKVLIDRVLRLMLPRPNMGIESASFPSRILCLTFTKTAAAEMSSRVYERLSEWSVKSDLEIEKDLISITGYNPTEEMIGEARKLFAKVLDSPGGIKIMTIHSFCQSILKTFPVEAGLPPHFKLMDEKDAIEYLTECLRSIIKETYKKPNSILANSFNLLTLHLDSKLMSELMHKIMSKRSLLSEILNYNKDKEGEAGNTIIRVFHDLGVSNNLTENNIIESFIKGKDKEELKKIAQGLYNGTKTDKAKAKQIELWINGSLEFNEYKLIFLAQKGYIRARLATKDAVKEYPEILEVMQLEAEKLLDIVEKIKALNLAELNAALLTIASSMLGRYTQYKRYRDTLDYDDLIIKTCDLFSEENIVPWVLYKLDNGIDHILVDEAQDTSRNQWLVVKSLSEEFFAGRGSKEDIKRTLFVVGDEKQSIFSFQGADPAEFANMQKFFGKKVTLDQEGWEVFLDYSFRSTSAVLKIVDSVFSNENTRRGVVSDLSREVKHSVFRNGEAGLVELWPILKNAAKKTIEPWQLPVTIDNVDNSASLLANKIASTIRGWFDDGEILQSKARAICAGDILILVQSRGAFVEILMRALKSANIDVAGVDRISLLDEIAIIDILSLAQFALLPKDSLELANVLKSPLIGMSEEDLYDVCYNRGDKSLWLNLRKKRPDISQWLQEWIKKAGRVTPYEFFAEVLNTPCFADKLSGRRAFYSRLGFDVQDAIDEFLNLCLHYEQSHIPSVQKFVDWFMRGTTDIKREQENGNENLVRIMTVHSSKGLQSPILFLPDTIKKFYDHNKGKARLLWPKNKKGVPLWSSREEFSSLIYTERQQDAVSKQNEEYRRLLYVALTRAEDRLYICGYRGVNKEKDDCWYRLIASGFPISSKKISFDIDGKNILDEEGDILPALSFECDQEVSPKKEEEKEDIKLVNKALPSWVEKKPQEEPVPPKPLAPSRPDEDEPAVKSPLIGGDDWKFNRGNIVHKLLELLPNIPQYSWIKTLEGYLARPILEIPREEQKLLAEEILAVLNHSEFSKIFGKNSLAEVPIVGLTGDNILSGKIDRLVVTDTEVLIVDYKSNRNPPNSCGDIPKIYLKQMALYAGAIKKIYPNHRVRSALLWTEAPILMVIPAKLLDIYSS